MGRAGTRLRASLKVEATEVGEDLLVNRGGTAEAVALDSQKTYEAEMAHFVGCLVTGRPPAIATIEDAVNTTPLLEVERESMETGMGEGVEGR